MSKAASRKAAAIRACKREPATNATYRTNLVTAIMNYLYEDQYKVWGDKVRQLSNDNQLAHGHANCYSRYGIAWKGKIYQPHDWTIGHNKAYCLPLHSRKPAFITRMQEIAEELDDLDEESYEVKRFLNNLFSFAAPPPRVKKILGPTIGRALGSIIDTFCDGFSDKDWTMNGNNEFAMKTFVEENHDTIILMNQRVMINLTTL